MHCSTKGVHPQTFLKRLGLHDCTYGLNARRGEVGGKGVCMGKGGQTRNQMTVILLNPNGWLGVNVSPLRRLRRCPILQTVK